MIYIYVNMYILIYIYTHIHGFLCMPHPVPAVVGTAINGGSFFVLPGACSPWKSFQDFFGLDTFKPMSFAQSMGEPPPIAIMPLHPVDSYSFQPVCCGG